MPDQIEKSDIAADTEATVTAKNIGGIDRCDITFKPGVTLLTGRNATNRTSLLTALADVLGGTSAMLKSDADEGRIKLTLNETTYTREYVRENGGLSTQGESYTEKQQLVDLFVRLLEDNPVRQAFERDDDLRDVIMEPVNTDQIQREIRDLTRKRDQIEKETRNIERKRDRLPSLERKRADLQDRLTEITTEIAETQEAIDEYEASEEEAERAEELHEKLKEHRQELQDIESRRRKQETQIEQLRDDHKEIEEEVDEIAVPTTELQTVESELENLRRKQRELNNTVDDLQRIISFNDDLLSGKNLPGIESDSDVTSQIDPQSQSIECWTCGSIVERRAIDNRLDELRTIVDEQREERNDVDAEISELKERKSELQRVSSRKDRLKTRLSDIEEEIEVRERKSDELREKQEGLTEQITVVEDRVDETEESRESTLIEAYQQLSELEYDRGQVEQELAEVEAKIEEIEEFVSERDHLEARQAEIEDEIETLRSRISDLERGTVEQFNNHMAEVLDILDYSNIARVWLERKNGNASSESAEFDLHIVRETNDGSVYEDTLATLSESEREVIGLIAALAGYLVHEVYGDVPFMLLDSLEAIDAERIADLIDYFANYVPFIVVALLPEDAAGLPPRYDRITATALVTE